MTIEERLELLRACLAGEFMSMHDEVNRRVGLKLSKETPTVPRITPPPPPTLTPEEEKAMQEAMALFRSKDY
jgi:hypothetical protein